VADLQAADVNLPAGIFFVASWLSQQAAEKALKALFLERSGSLPPRTHDLRMPAAQVRAPTALRPDVDALVPIFDLTRYPTPAGVAPVDAITPNAARSDVDAARNVVGWVRHELGAP
jgi:HEPN domain-containing protein